LLDFLPHTTRARFQRLGTRFTHASTRAYSYLTQEAWPGVAADFQRIRGKRPFSSSNPFFATLGIVGVLAIGQGMGIRPPETHGAGANGLIEPSRNPLTVFSQQITASLSGVRLATVLDDAQLALGLAEEGASAEAVREESAPIPTLTRYVVQPGDTVNNIAARHGILPTTITWVNRLADPNRIHPGQVLQIMSVNGTIHRVREGDTAAAIAQIYGVNVEALVAANALGADASVRPSETLMIPNATRGDVEAPPRQPAARPTGPGSERAFIASLVRPAQDSQRVTGVPASVTIAQAILETYWGTSYLAREANNYFGIKAHYKPGTAGVIWIDAWEVENGENVVRPEAFRKYESVSDSLVDHGRFFLENPRYARAMDAKRDAREFARRINAAGYATDPGYSGKLIALFDRYDLLQYDVE
jgi:flagellum-specific peptidoglycan hydrolase FlgJ